MSHTTILKNTMNIQVYRDTYQIFKTILGLPGMYRSS